MKLLLRRGKGYGDVLLATAVLPALKKKWPEALITFKTYCMDILKNNPYVHEVKHGSDKTPFSQYDLFIDLAYEHQPFLPILESYAKAAEVEQRDCKMFIACEPTDFELPKRYVVMHLGKTGWAGRDWKQDRFAEVAAKLTLPLFIIGQPDDRGIAYGVDLRGQLSMHQMAFLIRSAALFIGIDSFPMHIAQAFDVPGVAFFGSVHPHLRIVSSAMKAVTAHNLPCLGCHHRYLAPCRKTTKCLRGDYACENEVTSDQFWHVIEGVLK